MARFRALCALVICFASVDALAWPYYNQFFVSNSRQIHLSNGRQEHVISGIYGEWYNFTFYAESHFTILDLVFQDQSGHDSSSRICTPWGVPTPGQASHFHLIAKSKTTSKYTECFFDCETVYNPLTDIVWGADSSSDPLHHWANYRIHIGSISFDRTDSSVWQDSAHFGYHSSHDDIGVSWRAAIPE